MPWELADTLQLTGCISQGVTPMTRVSTLFVVALSTLAACVGDPPLDTGGGNGNGNGNGQGDGGGGGNGDGSGSGSGDGGGGGTTQMTATKFLEGIGTKYCDQAFSCRTSFPTDWGVTFQQVFGNSAQECIADVLTEAPQIETKINAGKILFDAQAATQCLAGITVGTCQQFWNEGPDFPAVCDQALVGTVANGGTCDIDWECQSLQSYCDDATSKCTPFPSGSRVAPATELLWQAQPALRQ
jgi:hypothetical protein